MSCQRRSLGGVEEHGHSRYYLRVTISDTGPGLTTRMAILGALSFRPMHGYEIRRELELRRVDRWAGVSYGSIYGRLRSLVREKHIEVVGSEQVGNRPARTVYRITPAGADEPTRAKKRRGPGQERSKIRR